MRQGFELVTNKFKDEKESAVLDLVGVDVKIGRKDYQ
jgi:hypothetical protein